MEKIGDFSKRCEATVKTLRYYDKLGLLVPDYIDKFTGYRYYAPDKAEEMRRINELKNIGFSLDEIKRLCAAGDDEKEQLIWEKRRSLENVAAETTRKLQELAELEQTFNRKVTKERKEKTMSNNLNMPFVNDERVIGRWEIVASAKNKEDFVPAQQNCKNQTPYEEIYFLPDGEEYWGFSWTKDYLKISFGDGVLVPYELSEIDGQTFMFINHANYGYGESVWVLTQTDKKRYTKHEIGRYDDINIPFANDETVLGKWTSVDFVNEIPDFNPEKRSYKQEPHLKAAEFLPNGVCEWTFAQGTYKHSWTKSAVLLRYGDGGTIAPAYEIRCLNGTDYLFLEWKNGDYIFGKRKPGYYVLKRGNL